MQWWRWRCWVLGLRRPAYALSEEMRTDERRRKSHEKSRLHR